MAVGQVDEKLVAQLRSRVSERVRDWRPEAVVTGLRPMTGGASSLTFLVELDHVPQEDRRIVLKVAPPGLAPIRNRDVLRQATLQRALQGGDRALAPDALFSDPGAPPEVPPFMAMNLVPGECVEPVLTPPDERPTLETVRARYLDAARVLAALHQVPVGPALTGQPVVTLAEEIDRWTRAFETVPDELRGDYGRAAAALHATMPESLPPVVNHGDYRLGNTLCQGERVMAIIDWEIWSIGDPRVDITWLTYFTDDAEHPAAEPGDPAGTPTGAEVVAGYEEALGRRLPDLEWFHALTRYKEAAATALLLKRALKAGGELVGPNARMLPALPRLVQETIDRVAR